MDKIYLIGTKSKTGQFNKLCKCFERFWLYEEDAITFLKNQAFSQELREFYAVYEVEIGNINKVLDGKEL
jgi:hypothetical protein